MCDAMPGQLILRCTESHWVSQERQTSKEHSSTASSLILASSLLPCVPSLTSTHGRLQTGSFSPNLVLVIGFYYSNRNLTDTASTGLNTMIKWLTDLKGTLHLWLLICFKGYYNGFSENTDGRDAWDKEGEGGWNFYAFLSQIPIFKITHPSI